MVTKILKKNPLFFAFFLPGAMDGILTLVGQDASYWIGGRVNEGSPAYYFLKTSPWLFILGSIFWFIFWYLLFKKLKEPLNLFLTILFIAGHSWGSASWVWKIMRDNKFFTPENQISVMTAWAIVIVYFILISLFVSYSLRIYFRKNK